MMLLEIETAIDAGKTVYYSNRFYRVIKKSSGLYVLCDFNGSMCGLNKGGPEYFAD